MKKIYSLVAALVICGAVSAQATDDKTKTKKSKKKEVITISTKKSDIKPMAKYVAKPTQINKSKK